MYNAYISENGDCNVGCDFCDKELNLVADLKDPIDSLEREIIKNSWKIIWQDPKGENPEGDRHICESCFNGFKLSESEFMKLKEIFIMKNFREKLNSKIYTFLENQPFLVYVLGFKKYYKIQYLGFKSVGETLKDAEENLIFMLGEKNLINKENVLENTTISLFYKRK